MLYSGVNEIWSQRWAVTSPALPFGSMWALSGFMWLVQLEPYPGFLSPGAKVQFAVLVLYLNTCVLLASPDTQHPGLMPSNSPKATHSYSTMWAWFDPTFLGNIWH